MTGNQIIIKNVTQTEGCLADTVGTYTWTYDGKVLSFKSLGDKCSGREYESENGQWLKEP